MLLAIDGELRREAGVTMAEASMSFTRTRQVFASSIGSLIDQTLLCTCAYCVQRIRVAQRGPHMLQGMVHKLATFALVESRDRLLQGLGIEPGLRKSSKCAARLSP